MTRRRWHKIFRRKSNIQFTVGEAPNRARCESQYGRLVSPPLKETCRTPGMAALIASGRSAVAGDRSLLADPRSRLSASLAREELTRRRGTTEDTLVRRLVWTSCLVQDVLWSSQSWCYLRPSHHSVEMQQDLFAAICFVLTAHCRLSAMPTSPT